MPSNKQDRAALTEEAVRLLDANPDLVFEERIHIDIPEEQVDFWIKFTSEWGGALYLLDETNKKREEKGLIDPAQAEFTRRTYRLGLITLTSLHDRLKSWKEEQDGASAFKFGMNSLDCFFIPAYLDDFSRVNTAGKSTCDSIIAEMMAKLGERHNADEAISAIEVMVVEYIRRIHLYAGKQR